MPLHRSLSVLRMQIKLGSVSVRNCLRMAFLSPLEIVVHVGLQRYRKDSLKFSLLNYSIVLKRNHVIRVLCLSSLLKGLSSLWKSLLGMVK